MNLSRRSFLKSSLALPVLSLGAGNQVLQPRKGSSFDPWIEIRADHLKHNVVEISRRVEKRPILAVIKNNGYGLGLINVVRVLEPLSPIAGFAVIKLQEAIALRDAGTMKPILLMGPVSDQELEEAIIRNVMPMVYTPIGSMLDRIAAKRARPIPIYICVDTGIGRVGVPYREAAPLIRDLASRKSIVIEGSMMTFTEDPEFDKEQLQRFQHLCVTLESEGIKVGKKHATSSFGLFQHPESFLDMVRPGMALFGIYPEQEFRTSGILNLKPAVSLKCRVAFVKQLRAGDSAGYNRAYVAQNDVWVATLPVGHTDGWSRIAVKGGKVRIGDSLFPVIASVSASHTIIEIGQEPKVRIGDVATMFDWQEGSRPEDVAVACGASVYDLTMHLNPLIPRHIAQR